MACAVSSTTAMLDIISCCCVFNTVSLARLGDTKSSKKRRHSISDIGKIDDGVVMVETEAVLMARTART